MRAGAIALAIAACTVARTPGYAQTLSFAPTTESAIAGARGAVAVDLNRDGWLDIATANAGTNAVAILLNRGAAGGFLAPRSIRVGAGPFAIAAGDLDRDGIPDLVVTTKPAITVLFLRTDATVRSRRSISTKGARGVAIADWTRDGALDIIYSDFVRRRVGVIPGTGSGTFAAPLVWTLTSQPQGIVAHDFNHDGFIDIAVANASGTSLTVLNGSAVPAVTTRRLYAVGRAHHALEAADVNADGWLDIGAVSTTTNVVSFLRGSASGFTVAGTRPTGSSPRHIAAGDFNHDARPDFAIGNSDSSSVTVLLARRDGSVLPTRFGEFPAGPGARAIVAGDFTNDGRTDMAVSAQRSPTLTLFENDTTFVRAGFSFVYRSVRGYPNGRTVFADFNQNGIPDAVADDTVLLDGTTRLELDTNPQLVMTDAATGEINRDGHADIVVVTKLFDAQNNTDDGVAVYHGNGRGAFSLGRQIDLPRAEAVRIAGVNRDGRPDIIVNAIRTVHVLLQTASGFSRRDIVMPEGIFSFEVADTTRDGIVDLVVFRWERGTFAVYHGDGGGGFTFSHEFGGNLYALWFTLVDLNHDGRLDLAYYSTGRVIVILAQGTTTWGPAVEYPSTPNDLLDGATFGDFNHDGHVDTFTWAGELLPGLGDGSFGEPSPFDVSPFGAGAVDLNRDGLLDVVAVTDVVLNERRAQNRAPVANAGPDLTLRYSEQFDFEDGGPLPFHLSSDPDLHRLTQHWRYSDGRSPFNQFGVFDPQPPGTYTLTLTVSDGRGGHDTDTMRLTVVPDP